MTLALPSLFILFYSFLVCLGCLAWLTRVATQLSFSTRLPACPPALLTGFVVLPVPVSPSFAACRLPEPPSASFFRSSADLLSHFFLLISTRATPSLPRYDGRLPHTT
jgi:hypothetical protein